MFLKYMQACISNTIWHVLENMLACTDNTCQIVSAIHAEWFLEHMPDASMWQCMGKKFFAHTQVAAYAGKLLLRLFVENKLQSFLDGVRVAEDRLGAHLLRHLQHILLVLRRQHQFFDPGPQGG